jgi:mercuric ion binding protein
MLLTNTNLLNLKQMKKIVLGFMALATFAFTNCKEEAKETETMNEVVEETTSDVELKDIALVDATFGVRGNCGMCKSTIEKAARSVDGVKKANWDVDTKVIEVTYDNESTSTDAVQKAIAASGYDTSDFKGNDAAYASNAKCCQYDRAMEIK